MKYFLQIGALLALSLLAHACAAPPSILIPDTLSASEKETFDNIAKNITNPCAEDALSRYESLKDVIDAGYTCHEAWLLSETISFFLTNNTGYDADDILTMAKTEARNLAKPADFALTDRPHKGPDTAPAKVVLFSDFQCPYCARGAQTLEKIVENYPNDAQVFFKHMPLIRIHPEALPAAFCAAFAHTKGKFWEVHANFFSHQRELSPAYIVSVLESLGGSVDEVYDPEVGHDYSIAISEDMADASSANVRGTPTFFVNGVQLEGGLSYKRLAHRIEAEKSAPPLASDEERAKARSRKLAKSPFENENLTTLYALLDEDEKSRVLSIASTIPCPCPDASGILLECVNDPNTCDAAPQMSTTLMQRGLENADEDKMLDELQKLFVEARMPKSTP